MCLKKIELYKNSVLFCNRPGVLVLCTKTTWENIFRGRKVKFLQPIVKKSSCPIIFFDSFFNFCNNWEFFQNCSSYKVILPALSEILVRNLKFSTRFVVFQWIYCILCLFVHSLLKSRGIEDFQQLSTHFGLLFFAIDIRSIHQQARNKF